MVAGIRTRLGTEVLTPIAFSGIVGGMRAKLRFRYVELEQGYDEVYAHVVDDQDRRIYSFSPVKNWQDGDTIKLDFGEGGVVWAVEVNPL